MINTLCEEAMWYAGTRSDGVSVAQSSSASAKAWPDKSVKHPIKKAPLQERGFYIL
jgi:hypothetical protein